ENSERFGLSQLHQLRGRVGRGIYKSYCLLITDSDSEIVRRRLSIITSTNDGFKIAEEDLKMRGSGAIFGTNQSGDSGLILSDFIQDYNLFTRASKWASIVYNSENPGYKKIRDEILNKIEKTVNYICLN
ncbi:MAG: DNA helicase RecG, partial [Clostridiaceae bacterium]